MAKKPYSAIYHYKYTPMENHPVWYAISGIPCMDKDGNLTHFFGIARNITKLMETQKQLKEETARAENSGKMKSAFLANMTHEIRTPLNAIVGFSDLLPVVDTKEERLEFIRIIRNNCAFRNTCTSARCPRLSSTSSPVCTTKSSSSCFRRFTKRSA